MKGVSFFCMLHKKHLAVGKIREETASFIYDGSFLTKQLEKANIYMTKTDKTVM